MCSIYVSYRSIYCGYSFESHDRFIKAYVVGTHLNYLDLLKQFKRVPTTNAFIQEPDKIIVVLI